MNQYLNFLGKWKFKKMGQNCIFSTSNDSENQNYTNIPRPDFFLKGVTSLSTFTFKMGSSLLHTTSLFILGLEKKCLRCSVRVNLNVSTLREKESVVLVGVKESPLPRMFFSASVRL